MIEPRFLPLAEAAQYLRVSPAQFRRLVERGMLPEPVRLGGEGVGARFVRWDRLALDALLDKTRAHRQRSIEDAIEEIAPRSASPARRNGQGL